nr:NAD(+)/NADH kinase [Dendrosporobacter quercicolus]
MEDKAVLTIGLFPNTCKPNIRVVLTELVNYCQTKQVRILLPEESAVSMGYAQFAAPADVLNSTIDVAVTLGGDGTLLSVTRKLAAQGVPVCGINLGRLGFLAEVEVPELTAMVDQLLCGEYTVQERLMLEAFVMRQGSLLKVSPALNDIVITKGIFSRMLRLELYIQDTFTANYQADGLIFATATGSTAYSLSAGGPIINPSLQVVLVTPICPHTLSSRSLIISGEEEVRVNTQTSNNDVVLTVDGQIAQQLKPGDEIIIKRAPFNAKFIKLAGKSYYETLRTKLWRGD